MADTNEQKIKEVLSRWADKIYPSQELFLKALKSKKLTIYHGVDPTGPQLHLGHSTNYLLLRKFQEMGHNIILLIGDFTARVGDPTGKSAIRRSLTKEEVKENFKTYKAQVGKILSFSSFNNPVKVQFNSKWLAKMNMEELIKLLSQVTHGQMIKRNMFQERLKNNQEIYLHEFLYPVLQGYDSVAMDVDGEVGGTDQTFNMLVGRDLLKAYRNKEKFVITTPLLENPKTGKKLMSKSEGGFVALNDSPQEMYGKVMALPDEAIIPCFKLCTEISLDEIQQMEGNLVRGSNPKDAKVRLAREIVSMYHSQKEAENAEKEFNKVFRNKEMPSDMPEFPAGKNQYFVLDLLFDAKLASSKQEAKRLVEGGGVELILGESKEKISDWKKEVVLQDGMVIKVGSRKFVKIRL